MIHKVQDFSNHGDLLNRCIQVPIIILTKNVKQFKQAQRQFKINTKCTQNNSFSEIMSKTRCLHQFKVILLCVDLETIESNRFKGKKLCI